MLPIRVLDTVASRLARRGEKKRKDPDRGDGADKDGDDVELEAKKNRLDALLRTCGRVVVAFSGGIDSSLLARTALDVLGPEAVTLAICVSPLLKNEELKRAMAWVRGNGCPSGVELVRLKWRPLALKEIAGNGPERCYVCKDRIYALLRKLAASRGGGEVADGTNADDLHQDRPGLRAARELAVRMPLADAGLGKNEVRRLAGMLGLSNRDQPASSCLATRLPTGLPLTPARLALVERWEREVELLGFAGCRVRMLDASGERVGVEVAPQDLDRLLQPSMRTTLIRSLQRAGARRIGLELSGRPSRW
ncbi:MAG: ATP-dependent sacrificial sulfur transferase LarE [Desulfobulbus sp.]|jgi:uncharacterized protein